MSAAGNEFGPWLRRKLEERRISLAEVCRRAGCDYTYLWRILHADTARGRRYTRPSFPLTRRIGEALDAVPEALAAAGYAEPAVVQEARVAQSLSGMEQHLAALRQALAPPLAVEGGPWQPVRLPLLGEIQAGELSEALADADEFVELPSLVAGEAEFALQVRGDSMAPTLLPGDWVTVRRQATAEPGQLVVAALEGDHTLKRFEVVEGVPTLVADNPEWKPLPCGPDVRIVGVVHGSFRPPDVLRRRPES